MEKMMKVHNLMEDIVLQKVNEICRDKKDASGEEYCTTDLCKLDIACFVLNRIPPKYVTSGRGLAHIEFTLEDPQLDADITALVNEGFERIHKTKRGYYNTGTAQTASEAEGPYFNVPIIKGRIFSGTTFEPIDSITISLYSGDKLVPMKDSRWQNPFLITPGTPGTYTFWPEPEKAASQSAVQTFHFHLVTDENGFDSLNHFFEITVSAEKNLVQDMQLTRTYKVEDLYLFLK